MDREMESSAESIARLARATEDAIPLRNTLVTIPLELRLHIYDFMTLSPATSDSLQWMGAYFTCWQLHWEMRDHLKPQNNIQELSKITCEGQRHRTNLASVKLGPPHQVFGLVQDVTVSILIPDPWGNSCCIRVLEPLYRLWLKRLHVSMVGKPLTGSALPYGDLKSLNRRIFTDFVARGKVNCQAVTFTLQSLAEAENARATTNSIPDILRDIPCTLTIVQDEAERQWERTYSSETRFKPGPHLNKKIEQDATDTCRSLEGFKI